MSVRSIRELSADQEQAMRRESFTALTEGVQEDHPRTRRKRRGVGG